MSSSLVNREERRLFTARSVAVGSGEGRRRIYSGQERARLDCTRALLKVALAASPVLEQSAGTSRLRGQVHEARRHEIK